MRYTVLTILLLTACPKATDNAAEVADTQEEQDGAAKSEGDTVQTESDESKTGADQSAEADGGTEAGATEDAASSEDDK